MGGVAELGTGRSYGVVFSLPPPQRSFSPSLGPGQSPAGSSSPPSQLGFRVLHFAPGIPYSQIRSFISPHLSSVRLHRRHRAQWVWEARKGIEEEERHPWR
jgi:hypothetical protein